SGVIELENRLTPEQRTALAGHIKTLHAGARSAGKMLILDQAAKFKPISISPEDAQFINSRRFGVEELCRIFGVPVQIVCDTSHSWFTNTESTVRMFAPQTLTPWIKKIETLFSKQIFGTGVSLEIDTAGLMRGTFKEASDAYTQLVTAGILDRNEVREVFG